jgi:hypothetical protein
MKRLSPLLLIAVFAQTSSADQAPPPATVANPQAEALVASTLVGPLAQKESARSKFSRGRMPAAERRVRILDEVAQKDAQGATFVRFAIDERHGWADPDDNAAWTTAAITGCAYVDRGEVFVQKGDQHRPAAFLLGKKAKAAPAQTCVAAAQVARK